ncbi:unnamed protein product [Didymodactylos carnosus]|uniref:EGF-like domain-containing protein n=1 Tax=Didymodactylos carnosus TaxID=1234261 RepID=A0A813R661_9BILA
MFWFCIVAILVMSNILYQTLADDGCRYTTQYKPSDGCQPKNASNITVYPCKNNATCIPHEFNHTCHCVHGFQGEMCEQKISFCELQQLGNDSFLNAPCLNDGQCISDNSSMGYHCNCTIYFTGQNCSIPIPYCDIVPFVCQNNGTCVSKTDDYGFNCTCLAWYEGDRCELASK